MTSKFKATVCAKENEPTEIGISALLIVHDEELSVSKCCRKVNEVQKCKVHPTRESYKTDRQKMEELCDLIAANLRPIHWDFIEKKPFTTIPLTTDRLIKLRAFCLGNREK